MRFPAVTLLISALIIALPSPASSRPVSDTYVVYPAKRMNIVDICFQDEYIWYSLDSCALRVDSRDGFLRYFNTGEELSDGPLRALFADSNGSVWFTGGKGVSRWDGGNWTFFSNNTPFDAMETFDIDEDENNVLWFATQQGVRSFDGKKWTAWRNEIPAGAAHQIAMGHDGAKWFGTDKGLVRYDGSSWKTVGVEECVRAVYADSKNRVWVLYANEKETAHLDMIMGETVTTTPVKITFFQNPTGAMGEDRDGSIWFGAGREFHVYDGTSWRVLTLDGDFPISISCASRAPDGSLRFGGDNNEQYLIENGKVICLPLETGPMWFELSSAAVDPAGVKWFGSYRGLSRFDGVHWKTFYDRDGLAGNRVYAITASDSFLCCGTNRGLSRYDGSSWTTFPVDGCLPDSTVTSLAASPDGSTVWAGTSKGVSRFDGVSWKIFTSADGLPDDRVNALFYDAAAHTVYAGTDKGAASFDGNGWTRIPSSPDSVTAILSDSSHRLWVGTTRGLYRYEGLSWTHYSKNDGVSNLPDDVVTALSGDGKGGIWAGTLYGSVHFNGSVWTPYLKLDWVHAIAADGNGIVWFARSGLMDGPLIGYSADGETLPDTPKGDWTLWTNRFGAGGFAFTAGAVWASPYGGRGAARIEPAAHTVRIFTTGDGLADESVSSVASSGDHMVWASAYSAYYNTSWIMRYDGTSWSTFLTATEQLDRLAADGSGGIWAVVSRSHWDGSVNRWDIDTREMTFQSSEIMCRTIRITPRNTALLSGYQLYEAPDSLWNSLSGSEHCTLVITPYGGGLNAITEDGTGILWCGRSTTPFGVARYDGVKWKTYTTADGLPSNVINALAADATGAVWAATDGGLARFNGTTWMTFDSKNSIVKTDEVFSVAAAPDGSVWFGGWNWIASFSYDHGTSVSESPVRPAPLAIGSIVPNPFNASTVIRFALPSAGRTTLSIYDITGRKVRDLVSGPFPAGGHAAVWNGLDDSGRRVSSGVYFARLATGNGAAVRKMLLVK